MKHALTLEELRRWEDHGAKWRALELQGTAVTLELCTCYGEPVDVARSRDPELIAFVRADSTRDRPSGSSE